jgi:hypothetical protein
MSEDNLTDAQRETIEREKEKFRKESREVEIKITNDTSLQQERLWDEAKNSIIQEYEQRGLKFDPSSIHTKEDMENQFDAIRKMRTDEQRIQSLEKHIPSGSGVPLTGRQTGEDTGESSGERSTEFLKKLAEDIPLDMMNFVSEKEMIRFLENVSHDTNHPSQKEAEKIYGQVLAHTFQRTGSVEFTDEGKNFGKKEGKWRKKKTGED